MRTLLLALVACSPDRAGCLDNPSGSCVPAAACQALTVDTSCGSLVAAYRLGTRADRPAGVDAIAARDDFVLDNGIVRAVIDAADHPNFLALSGGTLIDLAPSNGPDYINQISQAVGILPRDQAEYTSVEIGEVTPLSASVIARGRLYQDDRQVIVTRYELRACEAGVRIRTEVYNGGRIPLTYFLTDAYFWGDRGLTPFANGFEHPPLSLLEIEDAFRSYPFMSAQSHSGVDDVSYATVGCDRKALTGFNTSVLSAAGKPRQVVMPGDGVSFERIIYVARGAGSSAAQALAMQARSGLFRENSVQVSGTARFDTDKLPQGKERELSLVFTADDGNAWAEAVPDANGHFSVRLPPATSFNVQAYSFGRPVLAPQPVRTVGEDITFDLSALPLPANIIATVRDTSATDLDAEIILRPIGEPALGRTYAFFQECAPYLGPPHGSSPACNRVLVRQGRAVFAVPPGHYWVYATHGPSYTLQRQEVTLAAGAEATLAFTLQALDVYPADSLMSDFHVHGGKSWDTAIPDYDRVASFLASGIQVIAATDHDVVGSYETEMMRQGVMDRLFVMPGSELTTLVLWYKDYGGTVPRTMGHFNFWPLPFDPLQARNGVIWDELKEPGQLYDEITPLIGPNGVKQLNHPYAEALLGRDEGYARAIENDVRQPVGEPWLKAPAGGLRNIDHDVQEVMNGSRHENFLEYRALWYAFLKQGYLRAGTANSDSHTLNIEQVGYPRNVVLTPHAFPDVDVASFNAAVRDGRMIGTNGPYIDVSIGGRGPSITPFTPATGAAFHVIVRAAPWIPVQELRVLVNGEVKRTVPLTQMQDPFGTSGVVRYENDFALSELLTADGFVTFEAGHPLLDAAIDEDLGVITFEEPLYEAAAPEDARYHVDTVSPGTWPTAFTNPFVIDVAGDGWEAPGL